MSARRRARPNAQRHLVPADLRHKPLPRRAADPRSVHEAEHAGLRLDGDKSAKSGAATRKWPRSAAVTCILSVATAGTGTAFMG